MISTSEPDWSREKPRKLWDPSRRLLGSIRRYQRCKIKSGFLAIFISKLSVVQYRFWSVITGSDIPLTIQLGGGLLIPHPNGIVLHSTAIIGVNCLIHQQVTIGVKRGDNKAPIIAGHVDIGAGAKVIGNITIGEHAMIGANAVVTKNVEPYDIFAGIPAKKIGSTIADEYSQ